MSTNTQRTSSSQPNKMSTNTGGWLLDENGRWTSNAYWLAGGAALTVAAGVFLYNRVLIARPSEYIVKVISLCTCTLEYSAPSPGALRTPLATRRRGTCHTEPRLSADRRVHQGRVHSEEDCAASLPGE